MNPIDDDSPRRVGPTNLRVPGCSAAIERIGIVTRVDSATSAPFSVNDAFMVKIMFEEIFHNRASC